MHALGITTGADLSALSMEEMVERFGRSAQYYYDLCRGIDHREVKPDRERKSIGAEDTFRDDITTIEQARVMTAPLIDKVWAVCEAKGLYGRTVTLKVKFSDFQQITRSKSRSSSVGSRQGLADVVEELLRDSFPPQKPVRLLGVTVSNFEREMVEADTQLALPIH